MPVSELEKNADITISMPRIENSIEVGMSFKRKRILSGIESVCVESTDAQDDLKHDLGAKIGHGQQQESAQGPLHGYHPAPAPEQATHQ